MKHHFKMNNFSIFKNTRKEKENHPDYNISMKIDDEFVNIGACWLKDGKSGKYFSCQLTKPYNGSNGFEIAQIVPDTDPAPKTQQNTKQNHTEGLEYPDEDIKSEETPF